MIDYYNAFISYRHATLDSKIAEHVHKKLERFHVPSKISKKTGKSKITRIFRDKDELPITSNLSDTISYALDHSDYLIVICSPNTKESIWVKKEINYFLKNHSRSQILTVLAGGEPEEVIPEELLSEEREIENEDGTKVKVKTPLEPLSCDYRLKMSEADREELPRLAAAILGCSYDELMRRRRQYKIRRLSMVFAGAMALAIAFGIYMYHSNKEIEKHYIETLLSRSRYMAGESERLFKEDKRTDSLQVALAALPKDKDNNTISTAQAMKALTDATYAYETEAGAEVQPVWNYKLTGPVHTYHVSTEGNYLAALDNSGILKVWNTKTHDLVYTDETKSTFKDYVFENDNELIIITADEVRKIDVEANKLEWTYTLLDEDESRFLKERYAISDKHICIATGHGNIVVLSLEDGSEKDIKDYNNISGAMIATIQLVGASSDDRYIATCVDFMSGTYLYLHDSVTGTTEKMELDMDHTRELYFTKDDYLVIVSSDDYFSATSDFGNGGMVIGQDELKLDCIDPQTMENKWVFDSMYQSGSLTMGLCEPEGCVAFFAGSRAVILDKETGEVIKDYMANDIIIGGWVVNENTIFISSSGQYIFPYREDSLISMEFFKGDLNAAELSHGIFTHSGNDTDIIQYKAGVYDEDIAFVGGDDFSVGSIYNKHYMSEDLLVIVSAISDDNYSSVKISFIDPVKGEPISEATIDTILSYFRILGTVDKHFYCIYMIESQLYLGDVDATTGKVESKPLFSQDLYSAIYTTCSNDKAYIINNYAENDCELYKIDLKSGEIENTYVLDEIMVKADPFCNEKAGKILVVGEENLYVIDTKTDKLKKIPIETQWLNRIEVLGCDDKAEIFYFGSTDTIIAINEDGEQLYSLNSGGLYTYGALIRDDVLYVAYMKQLVRYNAKTGEIIGQFALDDYSSQGSNVEFDFDTDTGLLYVSLDTMVHVFDMDTWIEVATIDWCYGHHKGTDRFYVCFYETNDECRIGYFKHYTLDELVEKAKKILGDSEMSPDMKSKYGL